MFDEETERLAAEVGLEIIHPPAALRKRLDSKIVTTQIGNDAGVPSVPNVLGRAGSYEELLALAAANGLGDDLVVQTPYGDSGRTTFFVRDGRRLREGPRALVSQELKVMRRIRPFEVCVEGVITRHGTIVGPYVGSTVGHPELTPYKGGWCGNDLFPDVLDEQQKAEASGMVRRLGDRLAKEGYRGFFEVDFLVDRDTGGIYLGELNPRVSRTLADHHVTLGAYADAPLFLFHLLEYLDVDYEIDVDEINARWARLGADDVWSQLIVKETAEGVELLTATPQTGIYRLDGERMVRVRPGQRLAQPARRGRGLLPARAGARRLPVQGRRPRRDRRARPHAGRRPRADAALPAVGERAAGLVHGRAGRSGAARSSRPPRSRRDHRPAHVPRDLRGLDGRAVRRPVRGRLARVPGVVPAGAATRRGRRTWRRGRRCASTCRSWCRPGSGCAGWRAAATRRRACSRTGARRRYISGCTQAVVRRGAPILVRNYDYDVARFDATILLTDYAGRRVLGTGDCLWGLLDGMNEDGLAATLTFGGSRERRHGLRDLDRDALRARDLHDGGRGARGARPRAGAHGVQRDGARRGRARRRRRSSARAGRRCTSIRWWSRTTRSTRRRSSSRSSRTPATARWRCAACSRSGGDEERAIRAFLDSADLQPQLRALVRDALHGGDAAVGAVHRLPLAVVAVAPVVRRLHAGRAHRRAAQLKRYRRLPHGQVRTSCRNARGPCAASRDPRAFRARKLWGSDPKKRRNGVRPPLGRRTKARGSVTVSSA